MHADDFHSAFCRVQGEAQRLASLFNRACGPAAPAAWALGFLDCVVYHVRDPRSPSGTIKFLAEQAPPRPRLPPSFVLEVPWARPVLGEWPTDPSRAFRWEGASLESCAAGAWRAVAAPAA